MNGLLLWYATYSLDSMLKLIKERQHNGQATVKIPPKTAAFRPELRRAWLHSNHQTPTAVATDAVGQLTTQIISSIFHDVGLWMSSALSAQPTTPKRPRKKLDTVRLRILILFYSDFTSLYTWDPELSPLIPSLSDLGQFLKFSEEKLGIMDASAYQSPLACKHYSSNILSRVPNEELSSAEVGIPPDDVIGLKEGNIKWWNMGAGGKHKAQSDSPIADIPSWVQALLLLVQRSFFMRFNILEEVDVGTEEAQ